MAAPTPAPSTLELDPKYDNYDFPTTPPRPQNGHPGYLTTQQQAQVHQLRLLLESEGYTDRLDTLTLVRQMLLKIRGLEKTDADRRTSCASCAPASSMSSSPRRCKPLKSRWDQTRPLLIDSRFIDCEKWRKETNLDEELPNWDYPEKSEIFKYYPQYYHKTDKVRFTSSLKSSNRTLTLGFYHLGRAPRLHRAARRYRPERHVQDHNGRAHVDQPGGRIRACVGPAVARV
jgi:hypothetical protein